MKLDYIFTDDFRILFILYSEIYLFKTKVLKANIPNSKTSNFLIFLKNYNTENVFFPLPISLNCLLYNLKINYVKSTCLEFFVNKFYNLKDIQ